MKALVPAAMLLLSAHPAAALDVPRFDYQHTCRDTPPVAMDKKATYDQCLADEKQARDQLGRTWSKAPPRAREQCATLTQLGGQSSYVELITCLEMESPASMSPQDTSAPTFHNPHPQPTTNGSAQ